MQIEKDKEKDQVGAEKVNDSQDVEIGSQKLCRICNKQKQPPQNEVLIDPCQCKDKMKYVHDDCLKKVFEQKDPEIQYNKCQHCQHSFNMSFNRKKIFEPKTAWKRKKSVMILITILILLLIATIAGVGVCIFFVIKANQSSLNSSIVNSPQSYIALEIMGAALLGITIILIMILIFFSLRRALYKICILDWVIKANNTPDEVVENKSVPHDQTNETPGTQEHNPSDKTTKKQEISTDSSLPLNEAAHKNASNIQELESKPLLAPSSLQTSYNNFFNPNEKDFNTIDNTLRLQHGQIAPGSNPDAIKLNSYASFFRAPGNEKDFKTNDDTLRLLHGDDNPDKKEKIESNPDASKSNSYATFFRAPGNEKNFKTNDDTLRLLSLQHVPELADAHATNSAANKDKHTAQNSNSTPNQTSKADLTSFVQKSPKHHLSIEIKDHENPNSEHDQSYKNLVEKNKNFATQDITLLLNNAIKKTKIDDIIKETDEESDSDLDKTTDPINNKDEFRGTGFSHVSQATSIRTGKSNAYEIFKVLDKYKLDQHQKRAKSNLFQNNI